MLRAFRDYSIELNPMGPPDFYGAPDNGDYTWQT
jgi:hypothetical protein